MVNHLKTQGSMHFHNCTTQAKKEYFIYQIESQVMLLN